MSIIPKRKTFVVFAVSVLIAFVFASSAHSQYVLNELAALGININLTTRIHSTLTDMLGLLPGYGSVIALGLLLAFGTTRFLGKLSGTINPAWYWWALAGGLALTTALLLMKPLLDVTPIAGARSSTGLISQSLAGFLGGAVYGLLRTESNVSRESK